MTLKEIVALVNAGYTKADVDALIEKNNSSASPVDTPDPEPAAEPKKDPNPEPSAAGRPDPEPKEAEVKEDPTKAVNDAITEALKPFNDLYDKMAKMAGMPSLDSVQPKGIEDIISDFLKDN